MKMSRTRGWIKYFPWYHREQVTQFSTGHFFNTHSEMPDAFEVIAKSMAEIVERYYIGRKVWWYSFAGRYCSSNAIGKSLGFSLSSSLFRSPSLSVLLVSIEGVNKRINITEAHGRIWSLGPAWIFDIRNLRASTADRGRFFFVFAREQFAKIY